MDIFLEIYNLPRPNHEEIENLNRTIKTSQQIKAQDQMSSEMNSIKHLKKSQYLSFSNYSKKLKRKECFQTHYPYTKTIDKDSTPKKEKRKTVTGQHP